MGSRRDHPAHDHYAMLGVERAAGPAELRRAFRTLALRHHPDRAGPGSTEIFQRISEAYAILSDPEQRARYDGHRPVPPARTSAGGRSHADAAARPDAGPGHHPQNDEDTGHYEGPGGRIDWRRSRRRSTPPGPALDHLSGSLDALLAGGLARRLADGIIELRIDRATAATGGYAAIDAAVAVTCPTCAGHAQANVLWCRRCEYAGTVIDQVTFTLELPPACRTGSVFTFVTDPSGNCPPIRIRIRVD
jgi:molecular chaperone DnaJ